MYLLFATRNILEHEAFDELQIYLQQCSSRIGDELS